MTNQLREAKAPAYAWIYPHLAKVARDHGYALAIHGSCNRDLDLIAVPWVDDASEPSVLIDAMRERIDGVIVPTGTHGGRWDGTKFVDAFVENPSVKPHGRLAWNIHFTSCEFYLDVSVMPRTLATYAAEQLTGDGGEKKLHEATGLLLIAESVLSQCIKYYPDKSIASAAYLPQKMIAKFLTDAGKFISPTPTPTN